MTGLVQPSGQLHHGDPGLVQHLDAVRLASLPPPRGATSRRDRGAQRAQRRFVVTEQALGVSHRGIGCARVAAGSFLGVGLRTERAKALDQAEGQLGSGLPRVRHEIPLVGPAVPELGDELREPGGEVGAAGDEASVQALHTGVELLGQHRVIPHQPGQIPHREGRPG